MTRKMHPDARTRDSAGTNVHRRLGVSGMTCAGEAAGLEHRLRHHSGVVQATVNPVTEQAYIDYDPTILDLSDLIELIEAEGYGVE
jgi:Cu+-exporting ATPase